MALSIHEAALYDGGQSYRIFPKELDRYSGQVPIIDNNLNPYGIISHIHAYRTLKLVDVEIIKNIPADLIVRFGPVVREDQSLFRVSLENTQELKKGVPLTLKPEIALLVIHARQPIRSALAYLYSQEIEEH